jgi:hypothetical protein
MQVRARPTKQEVASHDDPASCEFLSQVSAPRDGGTEGKLEPAMLRQLLACAEVRRVSGLENSCHFAGGGKMERRCNSLRPWMSS